MRSLKVIIYFSALFFVTGMLGQETDTILVRLKKNIAVAKNDSLKIIHYLRLNKYYHARDLYKAENLLSEILIMLDTVDYDARRHRAQIYSRRGIIARVRGDYPKALRNYNKANALYEEINDTEKLINLYTNIGNLYNYQYDYKTGAKYLKKSIQINTKPIKESLGISYRLLAGNFESREMKDSALYYLEKARAIFKEINVKIEYYASNIQFVRYCLLELDETASHDHLLAMAKETTAYFKKKQHKHYLSESYYDLVKINFNTKNYALAEKYADTTIRLANQIQKKHLESMTYKLRSQIYEKQGKLSKALVDYKAYEKMQKEIYTDKKSKEIREIEMAGEFEKKKMKDSILYVKQKEILVLEKEKTQAQNELLVLLSVLGILLAFFVIRRLWRKWRREQVMGQQIEKELKQSHKEISVLNSDKEKLSGEVNQLLTETLIHLRTKEKLAEDLAKLSNEKEGVTLKGIIADLKADKLEDAKIVVLKKNIETLNYEFLQTLKLKHPGLTKTDIEICSFIKIGFSRTEIANLRKTSIDAIKSTRYRLKKKLKLTSEDSLDVYIQSL